MAQSILVEPLNEMQVGYAWNNGRIVGEMEKEAQRRWQGTAMDALTGNGALSGQTIDSDADTVYNGINNSVELKPAGLMDELAASGVKYTAENVLMVTKKTDGMLMWLETGNETGGLEHIKIKHKANFARRGYTMEEVPALLKSVLDTEPVKGSVKPKNGGYQAIYKLNGERYLVAYGTNGFIVSFYPLRNN